ncbi:hypothetical protein [Latilactobacillus fuchuensis]|uniref:Lipoprotein n=2 Tax=Latilactobacillus fuchuensis TaxID=164393 RepID=A0A2N9DYB6_9LACO|nr:hypothetical protein [Latilactobacillus fuchuensis]SPC40123.1 putative lipoprotein [Latilactobacillus fuchuensis]
MKFNRIVGLTLMMISLLSGCQSKQQSEPKQSQQQAAVASEPQQFYQKKVKAYWLQYQHQQFFVSAQQPTTSLATKHQLKAYLAIERQETLSHDAAQKLAQNGFIFKATQPIKSVGQYGYGWITVAVNQNYTTGALQTTADIDHPLYNQYKIVNIHAIKTGL